MEYLHFYISSLLLLFCGYMIYFKDKAEWIAGFQEGNSKDRQRLTRTIGITSLTMGMLLLLTPIALSFNEDLSE